MPVCQDFMEVVACAGIVGIDAQRRFKMAGSIFRHPFADQSNSQVIVGTGKVGF